MRQNLILLSLESPAEQTAEEDNWAVAVNEKNELVFFLKIMDWNLSNGAPASNEGRTESPKPKGLAKPAGPTTSGSELDRYFASIGAPRYQA